MRSRAGSLVVLTGSLVILAGAVAGAAEPGQIGISLGIARQPYSETFGAAQTRSDLSFSYRLSDRLSLRPELSLGHASGGWLLGLGGTALRHFRPRHRLSPYLGGGIAFRTRDAFGSGGPEPIEGLEGFVFAPDDSSRRYFAVSVVAGAEYSISRRLSLFGEVEGGYRTGRHYQFDGRDFHLERDRFKIRPVVGLTLKLR